jgi:hypothetical protein
MYFYDKNFMLKYLFQFYLNHLINLNTYRENNEQKITNHFRNEKHD